MVDLQTLQPKERKAFELLLDNRWMWRTKDRIQKESEMSDSELQQFLQKYIHEIKKSEIPDPFGKELYGLKERLTYYS